MRTSCIRTFNIFYSARSFSSSLFEVASLRVDGSPHVISTRKEVVWMMVLNAKEERVLRHLEELGLSNYEERPKHVE
jgi:hypothetical protein